MGVNLVPSNLKACVKRMESEFNIRHPGILNRIEWQRTTTGQ